MVGWIYIPVLELSYPEVQGEDNTHYLHYTYEGTANSCGSIFLDSETAADMSDRNSFVYGHNMRNGSMFGSLKKFRKDPYLAESNPYIYYYTEDHAYKYKIFAYYITQVGSKTYVPFDEDFATVNPYLGSDGVKPFIEVCKEEKKGLFILVKTSNPSSGEFQDRLIDGRPLYELVGEKVAEWGADHMGDEYSYIGAVVGATYPELGKVLRKIMPKSYILVPGCGAQGGKGKDLVHFFNEDGLGAIVNSSRGIIAAYKQEAYAKYGAENFGDAARAAVEAMALDIRESIEQR